MASPVHPNPQERCRFPGHLQSPLPSRSTPTPSPSPTSPLRSQGRWGYPGGHRRGGGTPPGAVRPGQPSLPTALWVPGPLHVTERQLRCHALSAAESPVPGAVGSGFETHPQAPSPLNNYNGRLWEPLNTGCCYGWGLLRGDWSNFRPTFGLILGVHFKPALTLQGQKSFGGLTHDGENTKKQLI